MSGATRPLRVIFAGTPEFAKLALEHIVTAGHTLVLVLTQPDRPAGRGMQLQASAVKQCAQAYGIAVSQPQGLRLDGKYPDDAAQARAAILAAAADVMVVAAYGLILPQWVLDAPRFGCLNIHGSLLPRWRGAAPIHRAIEAGDAETGVTIMQMDAGLDTGAMVSRTALPIGVDETTGHLHDRVAALGAQQIVAALTALSELAAHSDGGLHAVPQPETGVTYAEKISRQEAQIDWCDSAVQIERRIRAFNPFPGAVAPAQGEPIKVWQARLVDAAQAPTGNPGEVVAIEPQGIIVATGDGALCLQTLQRAGGKRLAAADFLRGFALQVGSRLD